MCDPVSTSIMLGLNAGGQVLKGQEEAANNARIIAARNAATKAELERQHGYQDQSGQIFDTQLGNWTPTAQGARLNANQGAATGYFNANGPTAGMVGSIGFGDAGAASQAGEARTIADVLSMNAGRNASLGKLTGWDMLGFDNQAGLADSGRRLGTVSDLARNSASVADLEREVGGMNAYRPPSGIGDLLMFAGNAAGSRGFGAQTTLPTSAAMGRAVPANPFGFR